LLSIGVNHLSRILLATSGLLLILFLYLHLGGLIYASIAPSSFEIYAANLHTAIWFKWFEYALLLIALIHISLTLIKVYKNYMISRSVDFVSRRDDSLAVFAAKSQPIGGIVLLSFVLIHLAQLRFPRPHNGAELAVLRDVLDSPISVVIYILGSVALFLHLFHGLESAQRSLGTLTSKNAFFIRHIGRSLSLILGMGFVLVTASLQGILTVN